MDEATVIVRTSTRLVFPHASGGVALTNDGAVPTTPCLTSSARDGLIRISRFRTSFSTRPVTE